MRHNPTKYDDPQALFLEAGLKSGLLTIQEPKATDNIVSTGTARKAQAPNQTVGGTVGLNPIFTNFNPPMGLSPQVSPVFGTGPTINGILDWHSLLDIIGSVPGLEIADGLNALLYYLDGDKVNASLSLAAMVPFAGLFATGGKYAGKLFRFSDGAAGAARGVARNVDSFINSNVPKQYQTQVRNAFGSDVKVTTLTQDTTVYRYYGGDSAASSYWVTPNKTTNPISELALPPGNTAQHVDSIVLPKGTRVLEGTVAPNFGQSGGGYQFYVPNLK